MSSNVTTVEFRNVGASRMSWTDSWEGPLTHRRMVHSIKRRHALGSNDIEFLFDEDEADTGRIYVGLLRRVGEFTVKAEGR